MRTTRLSQVAVVTGAASGIGRALVHALACRGDTIVAAERLRHIIDEVHASSAKVIAVHVDVSDAEDIERLAKTAFDAAERVHLLINNAGVLVSGNCWATPVADWKRTLDVNLWSVIHSARRFVPRMLHAGGHIVNVSSMAGLTPGPDLAAYTVSKYGVVAHSECLAAELASQGAPIKVSVVCPGAVKTCIANALPIDDGIFARFSNTNAALQQLILDGMAPEVFAEQLLSDVDAGKFWIIPHQEVFAAVEQRAKEILHSSTRTSF